MGGAEERKWTLRLIFVKYYTILFRNIHRLLMTCVHLSKRINEKLYCLTNINREFPPVQILFVKTKQKQKNRNKKINHPS